MTVLRVHQKTTDSNIDWRILAIDKKKHKGRTVVNDSVNFYRLVAEVCSEIAPR